MKREPGVFDSSPLGYSLSSMRSFHRFAALRGDVDVDYAVPCEAVPGFDYVVP
jgi:hypothetical protein